MAMTKISSVLLVVGLLVGYGVGFVIYQPQIATLQSDLSETETALSASQSEVESLEGQLADAETQITNLIADLDEARATIADHEMQISNLESDLTETQNQLTELLNGFSMQVIPADMVAIPGQRCVLLVVVEGGGKEQAVGISTTVDVSDSEVTVEPEAITPGQVAEVTVIPDEASVNSSLTVTVTGDRGGFTQTETTTIQVIESLWGNGDDGRDGGDGDEDLPYPLALQIRDKFVPLLSQFPELGVTNETEWTGTIVHPDYLVVGYYLFFSDEWEMGVCWHVTMEPHNWARIYLRHRFTEVRPSYAFDISSWSAEDAEPYAVYLKGKIPPVSFYEVWR